MKRMCLVAVGCGVVGLAGCGNEGSSTAPPKPGTAGAAATNPAERNDARRKLTVKAPTEQNVTQDKTDEFSVSVDRDNFAGPIDIEVRDLPPGVTLVTTEMTIPAGKDSLAVTIKAAADATVAEDHLVKVVAKAKDMPEASATFKLDVKPKS